MLYLCGEVTNRPLVVVRYPIEPFERIMCIPAPYGVYTSRFSVGCVPVACAVVRLNRRSVSGLSESSAQAKVPDTAANIQPDVNLTIDAVNC